MMPPKTALTVLLVATAFVAGCIAEPQTQEWTPLQKTQEPEPVRSERPEPQPVDPEPTRSNGPTFERRTPQPTSVPITLNGRTALRGCTGRSCEEIQPGHNTSMPLDAFAVPLFLNGTLTWNAETPATSRMYAYLYNEQEDDGGPFMGSQQSSKKVAGQSPLHVSFDFSQRRGAESTLVIDNMDCFFPDGPALNCAFYGSAGYTLPQDFTFEGELTGWN